MGKSIIKILAFLLIFLPTYFSVYAQNIVCPPDITINSSQTNPEDNYGALIVNLNEPYETKEFVQRDIPGCESEIFGIYTKTFTVTTQSNEVFTCDQLITIERSEYADYNFPPDITISDVNPYKLGLELTGDINSTYISEFSSFHEDALLQTGTGSCKIFRTWKLVNWCQGDFITKIQIITTENPQTLSVTKPVADINDQAVSYSELRIKDELGNNVNYDNCTSGTTPIYEILNCIIENNNAIETLTIEIIKDDAPLNGVSTLDLALMIRHALRIKPFENYAIVVAGQINEGDKNVTGIDLVELRKLILGIYTELPNQNPWIFYHENLVHSNENSQPEWYDLSFDSNEFPLRPFNIIAIKKGDVNGSAAP